jgi:hypothetical protein
LPSSRTKALPTNTWPSCVQRINLTVGSENKTGRLRGILFFFKFFIIHLFTCAYIVWVISPLCPSPPPSERHSLWSFPRGAWVRVNPKIPVKGWSFQRFSSRQYKSAVRGERIQGWWPLADLFDTFEKWWSKTLQLSVASRKMCSWVHGILRGLCIRAGKVTSLCS